MKRVKRIFNEKPRPATMRTVALSATSFEPTIRRIGNQEYQVFPAVLLVEGVHHGVGSDPVYYPPSTLEATAPFWNNIPVTIGHPVNKVGEHIMVNQDGTIMQQWAVGHVMNSRYEDGKLKAEIWIDKNKANQLAPGLLEFLQEGGQLEVSTGLLSLDDDKSGTWNSEEYTASVMEIVPDHFALLPNSKGACSWEDGCGVRWNTLKEHGTIICNAELMATMEKVRKHVDSMDEYSRQAEEWTKMNYVRAIYSDYFIYQQQTRQANSMEEKLLKQRYSLDTDNNIVLEGEPEEVVEEITYKVKSNEEGNSPESANNPKKKENKMATKKNTEGCCEKRVDALIANENNGFVETDKEWLMGLNEDQVEKLEAVEIVEKVVEVPAPQSNESAPTTLEGWLKTVPSEIRSVVNAGMKELDNKRAAIISRITANEKNNFTEEQLKEMDMGMLESISALIPNESPKYDGRVPAHQQVNSEEEEAYIPVTLSDKLANQNK